MRKIDNGEGETFTLDNWQVAWTPGFLVRGPTTRFTATAGGVRVGPFPDVTGWADDYLCADGGPCWSIWPTLTVDQRALEIVDLMYALTVYDSVSDQLVFREFMKITPLRQVEPFVGMRMFGLRGEIGWGVEPEQPRPPDWVPPYSGYWNDKNGPAA